MAAGECRLTASQPGNAGYDAADDVSRSFQVAKATSTTDLAAAPNPTTVGETVTLTATVSGHQPGGEVVFKDGAAILGRSALGGSGQASIATAALGAGSHELVADYEGDADNEPSSSSPLAQRIEDRPDIAPPSCRPPTATPSAFTPGRKVEGRQVPGVRARIEVNAPALLEIAARLRFRRDGRTRNVYLGTHSLPNPGTRNLRLALPASLRRALPLGAKVRLRLRISAATGCGQPRVSRKTIRTRVVKVLAGDDDHRRRSS